MAFTRPFWDLVEKSDHCWIWQGPQSGLYGRFDDADGQRHVAHRYAWESVNGPIPAGLLGCHTCDTPLCVRPDHVFIGTHADNSRDMVAKGRHRNSFLSAFRHPVCQTCGLPDLAIYRSRKAVA